MPGWENYRGKAWYYRLLHVDQPGYGRLVFGGVSHTADVYLDGEHLGHHYDAFTPFAVDCGWVDAGDHQLVVAVDNSFGEHSSLHFENDYYSYGGITRPVEFQLCDGLFIERMAAVPRKQGRSWALDLTVWLGNLSDQAHRRHIECALAGDTYELGRVSVAPGGRRRVEVVIEPLHVQPWSAEKPDLYPLQVQLLDEQLRPTDDLIDRVGFRQVRIKGTQVLLNDKPLDLRGYNRHEDHPHFANALPLEAMINDLKTIRDLGGNFIRTSHYPNDLRFLDLCDQLGFYVWEESHARQVDFSARRFKQQIADSTREMIQWHGNRPCIIMWGCLNECDSVTPAGRKVHQRVISQIRRLDPSRPVTFASDKAERDICLDLVDIVSWNRYDGWYGKGLDQIAPSLEQAIKWLDSPASGGAGKPLIMSEFGAGGIYGYRPAHDPKWSETYQARVLDQCLRVYLNHRRIMGNAIWQFSDVRVSDALFNRRARTMNNKGTVDEYRRPKLAYHVVKRHMAGKGSG
jgi:beta-glucuronidase